MRYMTLMKLKHSTTTEVNGKPVTLNAGEYVAPVDTVVPGKVVEAVTGAGLIRVNCNDLEPFGAGSRVLM